MIIHGFSPDASDEYSSDHYLINKRVYNHDSFYVSPAWSPIFDNYISDSSFSNDSVWQFRKSNENGSFEYDSTDYTKGSRSVKLALYDNSDSHTSHTNVNATTTFTHNISSPPDILKISWQMKGLINGNLDPNDIIPYVRFHPPQEFPLGERFLNQFYRFNLTFPMENIWNSYEVNVTFFATFYLLVEQRPITLEFGLDWADTGLDASEVGTAEVWFDNLKVLVLSGIESYETNPQIEWNHTVTRETGSSEGAYSLIQTSDGGFAVAGWTTSLGNGSNIWLVKTKEDGIVQWEQAYDIYGWEYAYSVIQTSDNGFVLSGTTTFYNDPFPTLRTFLIKTDSNGILQWNHSFDGICRSMVQTADGGYALAGGIYPGSMKLLLLRTDESGNHLWNQTYEINYDGMANSLVQTNDDGFALAGFSIVDDFKLIEQMCLLRTDEMGNLLWNQTYEISEGANSIAVALVHTNDRGFALAGVTRGDAVLVKTNTNGDILWNQTYGGTGNDAAYSLIQTSNGGFAIAGSTSSLEIIDTDGWLILTNNQGTVLLNQAYGVLGMDIIHTLIETKDGELAFAGYTTSSGNRDMWILKTVSLKSPNDDFFPFGLILFSLIVGILVLTRIRKVK